MAAKEKEPYEEGGGDGMDGGVGVKDGKEVVVVPHRHDGVFIAKGEEYALCTKSMVVGESVYGENLLTVQNEDGTKVEYRVWDPFLSKLAGAIIEDVDDLWIVPGAHVLYLGAASGTTVSHVSDIVGPMGVVYAVELSYWSGSNLVNMAEKRTNVIPIIEDAWHPSKYRMLVGMVDVIFSDIDHPDQIYRTIAKKKVSTSDNIKLVRILAMNASYFLKNEGHFVISIKANHIDSTAPAEQVYYREIKKLYAEQFKPAEKVDLEALEIDHAFIFGGYRMPKKPMRKKRRPVT